jgi:hypothetical protein
MIQVLIHQQSKNRSEIRYTLLTLFGMMGIKPNWTDTLPTEGPVLWHGENFEELKGRPVSGIYIHQSSYWETRQIPQTVGFAVSAEDQNFISSRNLKKIPYLYDFRQVPGMQVLYTDQETGIPLIVKNKHEYWIGFDLIAVTYSLLTLSFENQVRTDDFLGRFQKKSHPLAESLFDIPWIDRYMNLLLTLFQDLYAGKISPKKRWPDNHEFSVALSHDIDRIRTWSFSKIKSNIQKSILGRNGERARYSNQLLNSLLRRASWQGNFNYITDMEKEFHSTFFFAAKRRHSLDPKYQLNDKKVRYGLNCIQTKGSAIGLHGSIQSATDSRLLIQEKKALETVTSSPVIGNRFHYLSFDMRSTFKAVEAGQFKYDSTLGFSDAVGYRCGTSLPFKPYCHDTRSAYTFWEIPMIIMDTVLSLHSKLDLMAEDAWPLVLGYLEETRNNGGCLTVNSHNTNLFAFDPSGYTALYQKILHWTAENKGWICSLDELCEWWSDHTEQDV